MRQTRPRLLPPLQKVVRRIFLHQTPQRNARRGRDLLRLPARRYGDAFRFREGCRRGFPSGLSADCRTQATSQLRRTRARISIDQARWVYDYKPEPDSAEAEAWTYFKPQDWL